MAPGNEYLLSEPIRDQLAAHDNKLIKGSTRWFPGETPEVHWDFHRQKEYDLLGGFLGRFSDIDFREGKVTVSDAAVATYGFSDEYLRTRIATTHFHPASGFNKTQVNGDVFLVGIDGNTIGRGNRLHVAQEVFQAAADHYTRRVVRTADAAAKSLKVAERRSLRIAPGSERELQAIANGAWENTARHQRQALGQGDE